MTTNNSINKTSDTFTATTKVVTPSVDTATAVNMTIGATASSVTITPTILATLFDAPAAQAITFGIANATQVTFDPFTLHQGGVQSNNYDAASNVTLNMCATQGTGVSMHVPLTVTPTTNQFVVGTTHTSTLNFNAPAANRVINVTDYGATSNVVQTNSSNPVITTGTWTITMTNGTTNFTMNSGATFGVYQQVGDWIFFNANMTWTNINGATGGTVGFNLPTNVGTGNGGAFSAFVGFNNGMSFTNQVAMLIENLLSPKAQFVNLGTAGSTTILSASAFSNSGGEIIVQGWYHV